MKQPDLATFAGVNAGHHLWRHSGAGNLVILKVVWARPSPTIALSYLRRALKPKAVESDEQCHVGEKATALPGA